MIERSRRNGPADPTAQIDPPPPISDGGRPKCLKCGRRCTNVAFIHDRVTVQASVLWELQSLQRQRTSGACGQCSHLSVQLLLQKRLL